MILYLKTLSGLCYCLGKPGTSAAAALGGEEPSEETTVERLKEYLEAYTGIPALGQRYIFAGKRLEDGRSLGCYNIRTESTIHVVMRLQAIVPKSC